MHTVEHCRHLSLLEGLDFEGLALIGHQMNYSLFARQQSNGVSELDLRLDPEGLCWGWG